MTVTSLPDARSGKFWANMVMVSFVMIVVMIFIVHVTMPNALDDILMLEGQQFQWQAFPHDHAIWNTTLSLIRTYLGDVDYHSLTALGLLLLHPLKDGPFGAMGRAAAMSFFIVILTQFVGSIFLEAFGTATLSGFSASVVPAARALELPLIAWGTASLWRILDGITGYRLSSSGWSIRGHATINR